MLPLPHQTLAEALRHESENLKRLQHEVAEEQSRFSSPTTPSVHDLRAVSSVLSDIYQGAEKAFERIVRALAEPMPTGGDWHQKLLVQMSTPSLGQRPAVIGPATRRALDELRRFRSVTRHRYSFELEWDNVWVLLTSADSTLHLLLTDLETFCAFLEQLDEGEAE